MSYYLKKIVVLKQMQAGFSLTGRQLSGIVKAEKTGTSLKFALSLINAAPLTDGEYVFGATNGIDCCFYRLGKSVQDSAFTAPNYIEIEKELFCAVFFAHLNDAQIIVCGGVGKSTQVLSGGLIQFLNLHGAATYTTQTPPESYQDEVVATDNYYLYSDDLPAPKIPQDANCLIEPLPPQELASCQSGCGQTVNDSQVPTIFPKIENLGNANYFDKVKDELLLLFDSHAHNSALEENIPDSTWVNVFYTENQHYTVGLIYDRKKPAYICYGVPGKYSLDPPEELKGFCCYLPMSIFDLTGDGYWMMYQSATTGECVHIDFV